MFSFYLLSLEHNYSKTKTSVNPRCYATGKAATTYMLSSFEYRNKKWISKITLLWIMKTPLLHYLKQISWQSMHKWKRFRTSKFTHKDQGWNFCKSTSILKSDFSKNDTKIRKIIPGKERQWLRARAHWPLCSTTCGRALWRGYLFP